MFCKFLYLANIRASLLISVRTLYTQWNLKINIIICFAKQCSPYIVTEHFKSLGVDSSRGNLGHKIEHSWLCIGDVDGVSTI